MQICPQTLADGYIQGIFTVIINKIKHEKNNKIIKHLIGFFFIFKGLKNSLLNENNENEDILK